MTSITGLENLRRLTGKSFGDYSDDVCGAVAKVMARGDKTVIWSTECENREAVVYIGKV